MSAPKDPPQARAKSSASMGFDTKTSEDAVGRPATPHPSRPAEAPKEPGTSLARAQAVIAQGGEVANADAPRLHVWRCATHEIHRVASRLTAREYDATPEVMASIARIIDTGCPICGGPMAHTVEG